MFNNACMNNVNFELVSMYKQIKNHSKKLIQFLENHKQNYDKKYYYSIRNLNRNEHYKDFSHIKKTTKFIYLNKTCYNELYKVTSKGQFNASIGIKILIFVIKSLF